MHYTLGVRVHFEWCELIYIYDITSNNLHIYFYHLELFVEHEIKNEQALTQFKTN